MKMTCECQASHIVWQLSAIKREDAIQEAW